LIVTTINRQWLRILV
ncbi:tetratricopeptide repeat family protein, partial [Vibrio parahaemolyticus V-223/04]